MTESNFTLLLLVICFVMVVSHYIDLFVEVIEYLDNTLEND
jgi:hypothetical protein